MHYCLFSPVNTSYHSYNQYPTIHSISGEVFEETLNDKVLYGFILYVLDSFGKSRFKPKTWGKKILAHGSVSDRHLIQRQEPVMIL